MSERNRRRKKKKSNSSYVLDIVLCLIAITAMALSMVFLVRFHDISVKNAELQSMIDVYEDPENPYISQDEADFLVKKEHDTAFEEGRVAGQNELLEDIKAQIIESDSPSDTIKNLYPNDLLVMDDNEILFYPILDTLKKHSYDKVAFNKLENGRIVYNGSAASTETWIDVSKYQEKINWSEVADSGINGAIIRVGYRGYSKGDIMDDDLYEKNMSGALKNKLKVGVYFLTQATSDEEAEEEAYYVLDKIKDTDISGPVVIDVEKVGGEDARGNKLSIDERTGYVITFLETIKNAGYETCIYGNLKTFLLMLDLERIEDYSKWFAGYTNTPYFPYAMDMWQYTDKGKIDGISGDVDLNIRFINN